MDNVKYNLNLDKFIVIFLIYLLPIKAESQLDFKKINDSAWVYTTYNTYKNQKIDAHGFLRLTSKGVVMIDTPWDSTQFQPLLDSIKLKFNAPVALIISTHWHEDRSLGLEFYKRKGIKTYSTEATRNLCIEHQLPQAEFTFESDTVFHLGTYHVETFYPGAGHTSDNIVVYFPEINLLVGGCFIKSVEAEDLGNLVDANGGMWYFAVKTLMNRFPKTQIVIPGHGAIEDKGIKAIKWTKKMTLKLFRGRKIEKKKAK